MRELFLFLILSICGYSYAMDTLSYVDEGTWLLACAETNCRDAVEALLDKGVNISTRSSLGNTALHRACYRGHTATAKLLLERDASVNARNSTGATPLHLLVSSGNVNKDVLELLFAYGAHVDAFDLYWNTPLHYAAIIGSSASAKSFLEQLVYYNAKCSYENCQKRMLYLLRMLKQKRMPRDLVKHIFAKGVGLHSDIAVLLGCAMLTKGPKVLDCLAGTALHAVFDATYIARLLVSLSHQELVSLANKRNSHGAKAYRALPHKERKLLLADTIESQLVPGIERSLVSPNSRRSLERPINRTYELLDDYAEGRQLRRYFFDMLYVFEGTPLEEMLPIKPEELLEVLASSGADVVCMVRN